jgi:hypothetical protein
MGSTPIPKSRLLLGQWFKFEVRAVGGDFRIRVNDRTTVEYNETMGGPTEGFLALQCYESVTVVEFKQIKWASDPVELVWTTTGLRCLESCSALQRLGGKALDRGAIHDDDAKYAH